MMLDGKHAAIAGAVRPPSAPPPMRAVLQNLDGPAEVLHLGELLMAAAGADDVVCPGDGHQGPDRSLAREVHNLTCARLSTQQRKPSW